jgi:protoporphyrinogen oxidase
MRDVEHVVLGAGVAGLCAARLLVDAGASNLLIIDQYSEPGGNQKSFEINGYTYDVGAFYYWHSMPMFKMFPEMLENCVPKNILIERISPEGVVGPYPFSYRREFLDRGPLYWLAAFSSLSLARLRRPRFVTAEDFSVYWMGRKLYTDLGMAQYIERFFGIPGNGIEAQFAVSRMSAVSEIGKLSFWLRRINRELKKAVIRPKNSPADVLLVRPEKGLPHMYGRAIAALIERGVDVRLGHRINRIEKKGDRFEISAEDLVVRTANVVCAIPIKQVSNYFDIAPGKELECVDLVTLFVSFAGDRGFDGSILYNWGRVGRWKRLTMHSDYYGLRGGREYASVEVPLFRYTAYDTDMLIEDFMGSIKHYKIFQGDIRFEDYRLLENAYPAYTLGTSEKVSRALSELNDLGIQSVGRQGRFDYLPTGEHVAKQVASNLTMAGKRIHLPSG